MTPLQEKQKIGRGLREKTPFTPVRFFNRSTKDVVIVVTQESLDRFFDNRDPFDWVMLTSV